MSNIIEDPGGLVLEMEIMKIITVICDGWGILHGE